MRSEALSWNTVFGVLQWTIAIAAILGTLALFTWILLMLVRKDK